MHLELTSAQEAFQSEIREYFAGLGNAGVRRARPGSHGYREVLRQLGRDGWLGVGWPRAYGGQARSATEQLIFYDEAARAEVPLPLVTITTVGPAIMRYCSGEQKARFLP